MVALRQRLGTWPAVGYSDLGMYIYMYVVRSPMRVFAYARLTADTDEGRYAPENAERNGTV